MEKEINCHVCYQNKKESKIINYRNKKYHEICLLSTYPYEKKEVMSEQGELMKITRELMLKYFEKHGSLENFGAFVSDFVEMSEWLKNREENLLQKLAFENNAEQKFRQ
jgi:hypothetical protein